MQDHIARALADQRQQWQSGNRVPAETYLAADAELSADEDAAVQLILGELLLRRELGETPSLDEYASRFPQYAEPLRRLLALRELLAAEVVSETEPLRSQSTPGPDGLGPGGAPVIPGYQIEGRLGSGGRGVVYRARQLSLGRVVALKMIKHHEDMADAAELAWFRREAEAVARLHHPNIVQIHELGEHDGRPYFSMELVEGGDLAKRLRGGPLSPAEAAGLVEVLARAVQHAHERGVIHRDLKPSNVLLTADGVPKVADFGLAKQLGGDRSLTESGAIIGTAAYMAPEQAAGKTREVGPLADVYALGAILYQCLTGRPPFQGTDLVGLLRRVQETEPAAPHRLRREVPLDLETICLKCLRKEPANRYASAGELADDLARFRAGEPIRARPRRWYEKLGRELRRRPVLSAALVLLMLVGAAAPMVVERLSPDHPRKDAERRLARGEPFEFAGHRGLPGTFKAVLGDIGVPRPNAQEDCATVETMHLGLLEIVRDPGSERFRLRVELRHDWSVGGSFVGLTFGHRESGPAGARQGCFFGLTFAERGVAAEARRGRNGEPVSVVRLQCHCFRERGNELVDPRRLVGRELEFRPALPVSAPGPWRTLAVEVGPQGVLALWGADDGPLVPVAEASAAVLEDALRRRKGDSAELANVPTDWKPRSPVGLYVRGAKVTFRRVVVTPRKADGTAP